MVDSLPLRFSWCAGSRLKSALHRVQTFARGADAGWKADFDMGVMAVDLSVFPKAVLERMHRIWTDENAVEMVKAKIRQEKIAKFYEDNAPRWKEGFGEMVAAIDPYWRDYFRAKYGEDADTPEFRKFIAKQTDMFQVKSVAPRTKVGYSPSAKVGYRQGMTNVKGAKKKLTGGGKANGGGGQTKVCATSRVSNRRERVVYGVG